jgi:hypothetical protein
MVSDSWVEVSAVWARQWPTMATMPAANNSVTAIPAILIEGIGFCLSQYNRVRVSQSQNPVLVLRT